MNNYKTCDQDLYRDLERLKNIVNNGNQEAAVGQEESSEAIVLVRAAG